MNLQKTKNISLFIVIILAICINYVCFVNASNETGSNSFSTSIKKNSSSNDINKTDEPLTNDNIKSFVVGVKRIRVEEQSKEVETSAETSKSSFTTAKAKEEKNETKNTEKNENVSKNTANQKSIPETTSKINSETILNNVVPESTSIKPESTSVKTSDSSSNITVSKKNALKRAKSYLSHSAFSKKGLIGQLEFEQFTHEDAVYAAENCGVDWNEQAVKKAESYLSHSSFSKNGLIEQLEFEGFTSEQANYAATMNGF